MTDDLTASLTNKGNDVDGNYNVHQKRMETPAARNARRPTWHFVQCPRRRLDGTSRLPQYRECFR